MKVKHRCAVQYNSETAYLQRRALKERDRWGAHGGV